MEARCDHDVKKEKDKGLTMTRFGSEIGSFPDGCETNSHKQTLSLAIAM